MTRKMRGAAFAAAGAVVALALTACGSSSSGGGATTATNSPAAPETTTSAPAPATTSAPAETTPAADAVTLDVWENNTSGDKGPAFWAQVAQDFNAKNPNVTINPVPVQNEDLDGRLQTAMNGGNPPAVFLQRGGGKLADMVSASMVMDLTSLINTPNIPQPAFAADTLDGKIYAMPMSINPGGFWYSKDLFTQAGITTPPTTIDDLKADIKKLQDAKITPVALGAKDAWPAAHWFYWFSLRECSQATLENAANKQDLSDPCFLKAAQDFQDIAALKPFQEGFLTTAAQGSADSADGLIANHKAAMQLIGSWESGTVGSLTPDKQPLPDLGYFPFPEVSGGQGTPGSMMGGVDGFSCSAKAPAPACSDFLNFLGSDDVQYQWATAGSSIPANSAAAAKLTFTDDIQSAFNAYKAAPYVSQWLDTRLGQNVGNALNTAIVSMLAGQTDPAGVIKAVADAVAKG